jgi:hypothetical protein
MTAAKCNPGQSSLSRVGVPGKSFLTRSTPGLGVVSRMAEKSGQTAEKPGKNTDRRIVHRDGHCCDPLLRGAKSETIGFPRKLTASAVLN